MALQYSRMILLPVYRSLGKKVSAHYLKGEKDGARLEGRAPPIGESLWLG